jgi:putative cell wall-binding protein
MLINFGPASNWTSYSISFNANGGSGAPAAIKKYKDFPAVLPTQSPVKNGFVFAGWATSPSAIIPDYPVGGTVLGSINKNFTLYALWGREIPLTRYSGGTRIDTAAAIADAGWPSGADTVILASGKNFADALAGGPLAYALDAPILLTNNGEGLETALAKALLKLNPSKIVILGGTGSVNRNIEDILRSRYTSDVTRYAGSNRIETAVKIAEALKEDELNKTGTSFDTAFITDGLNFPDALSISPVAAIKGQPILFTSSRDPGNLHEVTSDYITESGIANAVVIGGSATVSTKVLNILQDEKGLAVERVAGGSRYSTAVAIYQKYSSIFSGTSLCITTGKNFPDALAGSSYAAKIKSPLFLMDTGRYESAIRTLALKPAFSNIYVFGGSGSLPDSAIVQHLVI